MGPLSLLANTLSGSPGPPPLTSPPVTLTSPVPEMGVAHTGQRQWAESGVAAMCSSIQAEQNECRHGRYLGSWYSSLCTEHHGCYRSSDPPEK